MLGSRWCGLLAMVQMLLGFGLAEAQPRKIVAVLPLEDQTGLSPERVEGLSDYLRIRIGALGIVDVVDKGVQAAETKRLISEAQEESYRACFDDSCQIPLGKQLAANYILRGKLQRFEAVTVLSLELIDVASAASTAAVSERTSGGADSMLVAIDHLAEELGRRLRGEPESKVGLVGGLGTRSSTVSVLGVLGGLVEVPSSTVSIGYGVIASPPEEGPSVVQATIYLTVAASLLAGGLALDLVPDSAHNGGLDFLDVVPVLMYGTSILFGITGLGSLM